jgi:hypothetical protein
MLILRDYHGVNAHDLVLKIVDAIDPFMRHGTVVYNVFLNA